MASVCMTHISIFYFANERKYWGRNKFLTAQTYLVSLSWSPMLEHWFTESYVHYFKIKGLPYHRDLCVYHHQEEPLYDMIFLWSVSAWTEDFLQVIKKLWSFGTLNWMNACMYWKICLTCLVGRIHLLEWSQFCK